MLKVHISKEKNIREIEAEGKLLDILAEAGSVVEIGRASCRERV